MRRITPTLTAELFYYFGNPKKVKIGAGPAYPLKTFRELVEHVARLSFMNKDHLLFYRGQAVDFRNKAGVSSFYPTIYRGDYLTQKDLTERFNRLEQAGLKLAALFEDKKIEGYKEVKKRLNIQWSILQHYEVCPTPFLDFTHSLRVACSFAMSNNETDKAYIFIFGLPYLTNRISINSEHDLVNIRLLSICPPTALRPYFQEGYLVSTDEITDSYDTKSELDFNNRLIAKFEIPNNLSFWGKDFDRIPEHLLYPENDPVLELCKAIASDYTPTL
ncbi:MAG: FRG domain-containing protein [Dysgonomonas sp.]